MDKPDGEKIEKATGIMAALATALSHIPGVRQFQETMIKLGGKNSSAEIARKKSHLRK
tara:strand:- start:214 stop:387 length:174 start_codon:yes stop_codon:yes gene_type:complete